MTETATTAMRHAAIRHAAIQHAAVGFKRDPAKKNQPDLKFEMTTLNDKG